MGTDLLVAALGGIGVSAVAASMLYLARSHKPEISVDDWKILYERERIINYLPYYDFSEKDELYIGNDESIGFVVECNPLIFAGDKVHAGIVSAIEALPEGTAIQFILFSSPNIYPLYNSWMIGKSRKGELESEIVKSYTKFIESKRYEQITKNFNAPVRDFRLIIAIKYGGKEREYKAFNLERLKDFFGSKKRDEGFSFKEKYNIFLAAKDRFIGALRAGFINASIVDPNRLIEFVYSVMNQNHDLFDCPRWDGSQINNFMVANDTTVEVKDNYIKVDGVYAKSLSVKEYPERWNLTNVIKYIGNVATNENFDNPFIITLNTYKLPESEKGMVRTRSAVVMGQQMPYALFPRLKLKHQDLAYGLEKIEKGENLYYAAMGIIVFAKSEKILEQTTGAFKTYFKSLYFRLEEDKYINFPSLISMLPLGFDKKLQSFLGFERGRVVFAENIGDLAPVNADWKGNNPEVLLISPRGQLMGFDLFADKTGGFNSFVIGMTGSGKSVFLQWIALNYYLSNNKIWIIDIGRSYEKFCHMFGGQFIELRRDKPMCLNPFSSIDSENMLMEYLDFLIDFFLLIGMPREKQLSEQLEKLMKSYLEGAIKESYFKYGSESCVDTVAEMLSNDHANDPRIKDFIKTLSPYKSTGQYGLFFNGKSSVSFSSDLIVMENDTLENVPDLRDPALMLLTFHISKEIYLSQHARPDMRHVVIIDEAHKFLGKAAHIDLFIEQAYRRFRKHGASMILGTQGFEDFYGGEEISRAGRVIVQNSAWKFLMMQTATSREKIRTSNYFNFSEFENMLLETTMPVTGEYGEVMIVGERVTTKARIVLESLLKTMMFTDADLRAKINNLVQQGYSYIDAIRLVQSKGF